MPHDHRLPEGQQFFRIGEVATLTTTPSSKLRFWETRFGQLRPVRGGRGQRRYSRDDVSLILQIKELAAQGFGLEAINRKLQVDPNSGKTRTVDLDNLQALRNRLVALEERLGKYLKNGRF
jgi:DNA-binding transcriptional MerR regulator